MSVSLILAHPNPNSFNHAIANAIRDALQESGVSVDFHDLYAEKFDPLMRTEEFTGKGTRDPLIEKHADEIQEAEGIVIVHPNWWAQPPAILTGWLDRVLRNGRAYRFGPLPDGSIGPIGFLPAKAALVVVTSNTELERERALYGDPLDNLWRTCVFKFCGVENVDRRLFASVIMSSLEQRQAWLAEAAEAAKSLFRGKSAD